MSSPAANQNQPPSHGLNVPAGVCAMLFPGLGHLYRGEPKRGILAAIGVLGMFFGGMLIGGVDVIDSREDKWWFYGQAFVGPLAFGVDWYHQNQLKAYGIPGVPPEAGASASFTTSDLQLRTEHPLRSVFPGEKRVVTEVTVIVGDGARRTTRRMPVAVPAGEGGWVEVRYTGMAPSVDRFSVVVSDTDGLAITYPQYGTATSLHHDAVLEDRETDVVRFYVDTSDVAPGTYGLTLEATYAKGGAGSSIQSGLAVDVTP